MTNYLLGKGERLIKDIVGSTGGGPKEAVYTFSESKARLRPMLDAVVRTIAALPAEACPGDEAVAAFTLNPEYLAKSFFPADLLKSVGLVPVGSRPRRITPAKRSRGREPEEALTTQYFVMGRRSAFRQWDASLPAWNGGGGAAKDLTAIEEIHAPTPEEKIKGQLPAGKEVVFEIVLHTDELMGEQKTIPTFQDYLRGLGLDAAFKRRFYAGGLCFVDLDGPTDLAEKIALFTPVRALRQMPLLRVLRPTARVSGMATTAAKLPTSGPLNSDIKVAIFDGGIPDDHPITAWATPIDATNGGGTIPQFTEHGVAVTSAFLFGHINPGEPVPQPYAAVDHYRVFDTTPGQNPRELALVLERIDKVLNSRRYDFVNLSVGPAVPIEDDDVHAWTAVIDDRLASGKTLATIAVGNDGEAKFGFDRVQVPADCVNAISVGACDAPDAKWARAPYSSIGPGRSPGILKPDLVEFGGTIQRPFIVLSPDMADTLAGTFGTSFASPSTLRLATGIKAHFGNTLSTLAVHALVVHSVETSKIAAAEIGRGRIARTLQDVTVCPDDTVRVVYQGTISARDYIRAPIPVPDGDLPGMVTITATLCFSTKVDSHHPGNYTRAALEPTFRPHDGKRKKPEQVHADPKSFFGKAHKGLTEEELRRDHWKWEACKHASHRMRGDGLSNPVFDIHYNARMEGQDFVPDEELSYALVVSVQAKGVADLYNQVVRKYATQLEQLRPAIEIPIST